MKLRAPAVPLITHDPFFSIWSSDTRINAVSTMNWTGRTNSLIGVALIDGVEYSFLGYGENYYKMNEVSLEITALSTSLPSYPRQPETRTLSYRQRG